MTTMELSGVDRQRMEALARANAVRGVIARTKRDLKGAPMSESLRAAAALVESIDGADPCGTICVEALLRACRGVGAARASRMMRVARVSAHRPLRKLAGRERRDLALALTRAAVNHDRHAKR